MMLPIPKLSAACCSFLSFYSTMTPFTLKQGTIAMATLFVICCAVARAYELTIYSDLTVSKVWTSTTSYGRRKTSDLSVRMQLTHVTAPTGLGNRSRSKSGQLLPRRGS